VNDPRRRRSPEEQKEALARAKAVMARQTLEKHKKSIKWAKYALFIVGALQITYGLYEGFGPDKFMLGLYIDGGIGAAFIGLYFYSEQNASQAFWIGLILYIYRQGDHLENPGDRGIDRWN
jgi:predicted anti-sigma-YlaC factor YlaD